MITVDMKWIVGKQIIYLDTSKCPKTFMAWKQKMYPGKAKKSKQS